jgi:hypothetical protein
MSRSNADRREVVWVTQQIRSRLIITYHRRSDDILCVLGEFNPNKNSQLSISVEAL